MRPTWHGQTEQLVLLRLVNMPSAMTLHSEQFNLSWNVMGGLFSSFNLAQLSCTAGLQFLLLRISLYQQMTTFSHTGPKWLKHLIHRNSIHCMSACCWQKELTQSVLNLVSVSIFISLFVVLSCSFALTWPLYSGLRGQIKASAIEKITRRVWTIWTIWFEGSKAWTRLKRSKREKEYIKRSKHRDSELQLT